MWVGLQDLFNQLFSKIVSSSGKDNARLLYGCLTRR